MKKLLLLLSDLRGIESLVTRFKEYFPSFLVIPILFIDKKKEGDNKVWFQEVESSMLRKFINKFDFSDVDAMFVSFMTNEKVTFIKSAPNEIKMIWAIPGGDLYNRYLRYFGYPIIYDEDRDIKNRIGKIIRKSSRRR